MEQFVHATISMTNIGHFRAAGKLLDKVEGGSLATRLWLAPPTRMDEHQLMEEGYYNIYGRVILKSGRTSMTHLTRNSILGNAQL